MSLNLKSSAILLAGGSGTRMQMPIPKQFLPLHNKPIALYSFELFLSMPEIHEIIVVCHPTYQHLFVDHTHSKPIRFASPGERRQDSVYNGLMASSPSHHLICIHDSARPLIDRKLIQRVLNAGAEHSAATVGMPVKFTVKESDEHHFVLKTIDRSRVWEIQTPQVILRPILLEGFQHAHKHHITVTDDVSLAELLGQPVKLVEGSYSNIKITVPDDLTLAAQFLQMNDHA